MEIDIPATAKTYEERGYASFDCVGTYLWIWERLIRANGGSEVVAREVRASGRDIGARNAATAHLSDRG